jgi:hypothetical protein
MPNSAHNALISRLPRLAATTNRIRCSATSIVLHAIPARLLEKKAPSSIQMPLRKGKNVKDVQRQSVKDVMRLNS